MIYTIEKTADGTWKIGNGETWLAGFRSKMEAKFFIQKYLHHRAAGKKI